MGTGCYYPCWPTHHLIASLHAQSAQPSRQGRAPSCHFLQSYVPIAGCGVWGRCAVRCPCGFLRHSNTDQPPLYQISYNQNYFRPSFLFLTMFEFLYLFNYLL